MSISPSLLEETYPLDPVKISPESSLVIVVVEVVTVVVVVVIISVPLSSSVMSICVSSVIVTPGVQRPSTLGRQLA